MKITATAIVKYRVIVYILFIVACVYCALSVGRVQVNPDLTAFLPDSAETRRGLTIMDDEFVSYGSANIMVSNITYEKAEKLAEDIAEIPGVYSVAFDDSSSHYVPASALFSVDFSMGAGHKDTLGAMSEIRQLLSDYDTSISTSIGNDYNDQLAEEMVGVFAIALVVILGVLLFTSRSYFEVVIFFMVFIVSALLNMGTNFWLGEISSITNSIAVIMQLALAIDYAIILSHRYQDELVNYERERDALIEALSKAIVEISSSSLTTISGLVALTLMQFKLGFDLGVVLAKGIVCSLITVFLLMPGLIMLFTKPLRKLSHRSHIPDIRPWGRILVKGKYVFVWLFILIIPAAVIFSNQVTYAFADSSITELIRSESREAEHKIERTFHKDTAIAVIVPHEDLDAEKSLLREMKELPGVISASGLGNIEIEPGHMLTDDYTPAMLSNLMDIDIEQAELLYRLYGYETENYSPIFGEVEEFEVPLVDMILFIFEKMDQGMVNLDGEAAEEITELRSTLERGVKQLRGENWNRLVVTADVPVEGETSNVLVENIRALAESYYGEGNILVTGAITSARDLNESFSSDSVRINILTILFVFVILLCTFRSVAGAVLLVFVIQGSIWINFSFFRLQGMNTSFVTYMIVSAIEMGATIDYAIVIMNRYLDRKKTLPKREAMTEAVNDSFATVFTSGSIMSVAGLLIAYRVSDVYVGHIGLAVGRGALISVILVMTVLPELLLLCDRLVEKTVLHITLIDGGEET